MALQFTGVAPGNYSRTLAASLAMPFSMAAWVNVTTFNFGGMISIGDAAGNNYGAIVQYDNVTPGRWGLETKVAGGATLSGDAVAASVAVGGWHHVGCSYISATSRAMYLDGVKTTSAVSGNLAGTLTSATFGANFYNGTSYGPFNGNIAYPVFWKIAISDADFVALAAGVHFLKVRPDQIVACDNCNAENSPECDLVSSTRWTVTNPNNPAANPRIYACV